RGLDVDRNHFGLFALCWKLNEATLPECSRWGWDEPDPSSESSSPSVLKYLHGFDFPALFLEDPVQVPCSDARGYIVELDLQLGPGSPITVSHTRRHASWVRCGSLLGGK